MVPLLSMQISSIISPNDCTLPQPIPKREPVGASGRLITCKTESRSINNGPLTPIKTPTTRSEERLLSGSTVHCARVDTRAYESKASAAVEELRTPVSAVAEAEGVASFARCFRDEEDGDKPAIVSGFPPRVRQPMRSSIACLRCRRSKIKCKNDFRFEDDPIPCDTCSKVGVRCVYSVSTAPPTPLKRPLGLSHRDTSISRKRYNRGRLEIDTRRHALPGPASSILGRTRIQHILLAPFLTPVVWDEVFVIFFRHFVFEIPFLHLATIKRHIQHQQQQPTRLDDPPSSTNVGRDHHLVLLGLLALTARFHPELVRSVAQFEGCSMTDGESPGIKMEPTATSMTSQQATNAASEYYANALRDALEKVCDAPSIERVQSMLMLGLYEWGMQWPHGGWGAYNHIGMAIRMAHALGLGFVDPADGGFDNSGNRWTDHLQPRSRSSSAELISHEVKRRTMLSAYILEQIMTSGRGRVPSIRLRDLHLCFPCSETKFDLGVTSITCSHILSTTGIALDDSLCAYLVQLTGIWEDITKYTFGGERRRETVLPWDENSGFSRLTGQLQSFTNTLPDFFRFDADNYARLSVAHRANGCLYVSLHILHALCRMTLHRENVPYVPVVGCNPSLDRNSERDAFGATSAAEMFAAANHVTELVSLCESKVPHSSLVVYAVWTAALVGIYAYHFPHMDVQMSMAGGTSGPTWAEDRRVEHDSEPGPGLRTRGRTATAYRTLVGISRYVGLADEYVQRFDRQDELYRFRRLGHARGSFGRELGMDNRYRDAGEYYDEGWHSKANDMTISNGTIWPTGVFEVPVYERIGGVWTPGQVGVLDAGSGGGSSLSQGSNPVDSTVGAPVTMTPAMGFTPISQPRRSWEMPFSSPLTPETMRSQSGGSVFVSRSPFPISQPRDAGMARPHHQNYHHHTSLSPPSGGRSEVENRPMRHAPGMADFGIGPAVSANGFVPDVFPSMTNTFHIDEGARMAQQLGDHRFCTGLGPWSG